MDNFTVKVKNPETNVENSVVITEYTPTQGPGAGKSKLRPIDFEDWDINKVIALWGPKKVWDAVYSKFAQTFTNFTAEATTRRTEGKDGAEIEEVETDPAVITKDYTEMFQVLSKRGESLQAISRRLGEVMADWIRVADLLLNGKDAKGVALQPADITKLRLQLDNLKVERGDLEKARDSIKAKRKKDDEADDKTAPVEMKKAA